MITISEEIKAKIATEIKNEWSKSKKFQQIAVDSFCEEINSFPIEELTGQKEFCISIDFEILCAVICQFDEAHNLVDVVGFDWECCTM